MSPWQIWGAEWLKMRKSPLNRVIFMALPLVMGVVYLFLAFLTLRAPEQFMHSARRNLPFPQSLDFPAELLVHLGAILTMVFVASSVGGEYARDTWKMLLPRAGSRAAFLGAKLLGMLVALALGLLVFLVAAVLFGALGAWAVGLEPISSLTAESRELVLRQIGVALIDALFYGLLTLLATIVTRSMIGGLLVSLIFSQLGLMLAFTLVDLSHSAALALPMIHLYNIKREWGPPPEGGLGLAQLLGYPVDPTSSLLALLAAAALVLLAALLLFERRDLA